MIMIIIIMMIIIIIIVIIIINDLSWIHLNLSNFNYHC
jgi:hypothetical protein